MSSFAVALLRLAKDAHRIFEAKGPDEKRTLLNLVLSNCSWANGELSMEFRQPFDLSKETNLGPDTKNPTKRPDFSYSQRWLPFVDAFRTMCRAPGRDLGALFEQIRLFNGGHRQRNAR